MKLQEDTNEHTDILSQNSEDIAANKEAIEANRTDIDANKAEIEKIKNLQGYDSLTKVENIVSNKADQDYVEGLEKDVKINTSDIKELSEGIRDNILPALEANRTDIDKNASRIADTRNKQVLQNARLDNHNSRIDANKADVETLKNRADGAAAAVNLLAQNIALNKTNIESKADQGYVEGLEQDVKINTSDIKDLATGIKDNILPAIEANRTDIDKNASRIADTRNKQVLQNARLDNHNSRIDANKADVETLKNRADGAAAAVNLLAQNIALNKTNIESKADQGYVEGLEQDVKINTSDIKDLATGIKDNILPAIEANRTDIDKNASRITDTRNKQALQNARLDNHGERIDANKAAIGELAKATDEAVTNLGNAVSGLDENLAGTQEAVAENRKDIDKNASRITDTRNKQALQNARLDNHSNRIGVNEAAIATNTAAVAENRNGINRNASRITDTRNNQVLQNARLDNHSNRIGVNEAAIATNEADIATNKADIATNKASIITNRANITANTAAIATHNQRLDHLDNRVNKLDKDLKRGLATQAALTGLFQPYTVGKANVTAAVGGYKSQTAVAIGTGYRYNKHVATKAGIAFTQGGAAYNVGVNFEW